MKKVFVSILSLAVIMMFSPFRSVAADGAGTLLDRVVATVNGDVITWSEIQEAKTLSSAAEGLDDDVVLEELIVRRLLLQEAEKTGTRITEDEVNGAIGDIQAKFGMTDSQFQEAIRAQGTSFERYRKRIREEISISRYLYRTIRANIVVPEKDIEEALQREGFDSKGVEEIRLRMILLSTGSKRSIEEATSLGREIHDRIEKGEPFEELAREYSDAPSSDGSGDVGYVRRDNIRSEIADVAFAMEAGTVSDPFVAGDAVYILRVDGRRNDDEAYRRRRAALLNEKSEKIFQAKYREHIRELRNSASIEYSR